jgi:hypothetical protein
MRRCRKLETDKSPPNMGKTITRRMAALMKRVATAIPRIFAGDDLTPAQKARLEDMERDYEEFIRRRCDDAKEGCIKKTQ